MSKPILAAILSCSGTELTDEEKYLFSAENPLGVTLFSRNLKSQEQVITLIDDIKNTINRDDVLIAIDEEGGRVSRLNSFQPAEYAAAEILGGVSAEYAGMHAELIAADLLRLGINVNYAPVIDKMAMPQNPALATRCFSNDETIICTRTQTMIDTYIKMGICPCIKHIPGHFAVQKDPHLHIAQTNLSRSAVESEIAYLKSFQNAPMAMTSHIMIPEIDSDYPATLSKKIISELLRSYLGFDGFLISDAIEMHALQEKDMAHKTVLGLNAGLDAICYCAGNIDDLQAICHEKRFMTEKSLIRFAKIKNVIHNTPKHIDVADVRKRYVAGLKGRMNIRYEYDATEVLYQMQIKGEDK